MNKTNANTVTAPAVVKQKSTINSTARPTEKVQGRISQMDASKTEKWLVKTVRTLNNHKDGCTLSYWNGLVVRYAMLTERAKTLNIWEPYCAKIGKPTDHKAAAVLI